MHRFSSIPPKPAWSTTVALCALIIMTFGCGPRAEKQAGSEGAGDRAGEGQSRITMADSVSDEEMKQFMQVNEKLRPIQMGMQKDLQGIVDDEGLEPMRYNEIAQAHQQGRKDSIEMSKEEEKKFRNIGNRMQKAQADAQIEGDKIIKSAGMDPGRYQQIGMALQSKPELQKRYQQMMMERMKSRAPQGAPGPAPAQGSGGQSGGGEESGK